MCMQGRSLRRLPQPLSQAGPDSPPSISTANLDPSTGVRPEKARPRRPSKTRETQQADCRAAAGSNAAVDAWGIGSGMAAPHGKAHVPGSCACLLSDCPIAERAEWTSCITSSAAPHMPPVICQQRPGFSTFSLPFFFHAKA